MNLRELFHYLGESIKIIAFYSTLGLVFFSGTLTAKGGKKVTDLSEVFFNEYTSVAASFKIYESQLKDTVLFNQDISLLNTYGTQNLDLEYTGNQQYFKIMILYSSANKTQQDINILLNGKRITNWRTSTGMGDNLNQKKLVFESYVELSPGNILTLTGSNTKSGQAGSDYISIVKASASEVPNLNPIADFKTNIQGTTVGFDAKTSRDPDGQISSYQWTFGDGKTGNGVTPSHTYTQTGTYEVELKVTDMLGAESTVAFIVDIQPLPNQLPIANFAYTITDSLLLIVSFDASLSADQDGSIKSYKWNFNNTASGGGRRITRTFQESGRFTITLTVTDDRGGKNVVTREIQLIRSNQAPVADFNYEFSDSNHLIVSFDASSTYDPDGQISSYQWQFGDGNTGVGPTTTHTYAQEGTYQITLKAIDEKGASSAFIKEIVLAKPTSESAPETVQVTEVWLIDAENNTRIRQISQGEVINLAKMAHKKISFEAVTQPADVGEVQFDILSESISHYLVDDVLPYAAFDDNQGDFNAWEPDIDDYSLIVTPFSRQGVIGDEAAFDISIVYDDEQMDNNPPSAFLNISQSSGIAPVEFSFDASGSEDTDGYITSYIWNFGDGRTASGEEVRHTYELPGIYTVSLTVFDNGNAQQIITTEVTVTEDQNKSLIAQFTVSEHNSIMEHGLLFDATGSKDQKGYAIVSYEWNMGDGTRQQGETVYYAYRRTGTYYPSLTVTNEIGISSQYSDKIVIREYNATPEAYAGDDKVLHLPNNKITLSGAGSDEDGKIMSYRWTLLSGPETMAIDHPESPILALTQLKEGVYIFRFTVVDNNGASAYDDIRLKVEMPEGRKNKLPVVDAGRDVKTNKTTVNISAKAYDPDGQVISYHWEQVMGKEAFIQNKESSSLELTNLSEGAYLFRITVADNEGAKAHDDIKVIYAKKTSLIAAKKAFTPNGDGIDDTWHIENRDELRGCQLIIIDRAGNKVYEANPDENEWDASYHGSPLPSADYYYIIRCQDGNTEAGGVRVVR